MKTLIDHAWVLTMDEENRDWKNGYVLTEDDKILEVGEGSCEENVDRHIDGTGHILLPGFVNVHCHVPMIPFRTLGDDCKDRLRRFLFPLENEAVTARLVYLAARYGICEMLLSGVTTFLDMYYYEDEVARACQELGIRAYLGETVIGQPSADFKEPYGGLDDTERFIKTWSRNPRITPVVAPHGTTTSDEDHLVMAHELAVKYHTVYTLHASEMDYELKELKDKYGLTPTEYLNRIGVVDSHLLAAHCIHMTSEDLEILAAHESSVAHCIGSNTKAGKGVAPVRAMQQAGIAVGLGTDGPSSGNTLDLFTQMRLFASFHKTYERDRSAFPAREIVRLATFGGAEALKSQMKFGSLEAGKKADLVLVETEAPAMFPCYDPYSALVYAANSSNVELVMVDGKILVEQKKLLVGNLSEIRQELRENMTQFVTASREYKM